MPGQKALLLISTGKSTRETGSLVRAGEQLSLAGVDYAVCPKIHENPSRECVMEASALARKQGVTGCVRRRGGHGCLPGALWDWARGGTGKGQPLTHAAGAAE